jgi:hypothetical protein
VGRLNLPTAIGVSGCLIASFWIAQGYTGFAPTITCTNDELFYIRLSRSLAIYGQENHFGDYLFQNPERYSGTTPYHYLDLWLNAGISRLTGGAPQVCWQSATRPLLVGLVVMGLTAWGQLTNARSWIRLGLVLLCTAWGVQAWATVPFLNEAPSYTAYTDLLVADHQSTKWLPAIVVCWMAGFAYQAGHRWLAAAWWATLPIVHIGLLPWWFGTTFTGLILQFNTEDNLASVRVYGLPSALALVWLVGFYSLTQNNQIPRIGLEDGGFFGPDTVDWTTVAGQFLRVGLQLGVTLGPGLAWALGSSAGTGPSRGLVLASVAGLGGAYTLRCLTSDVLDAWQVLNLGVAISWVGVWYPLWLRASATRVGSLILVGFAGVSLVVRLAIPANTPARHYDYTLYTTTPDIWVPLPPVADRIVYDSIPHLLPTGVYALPAHHLPRFWLQPPAPQPPTKGLYRTELAKHLHAYPFCVVSHEPSGGRQPGR